MQKIRWFLLISAIIVALAAALQNNELIELQLFFFRKSLPLSVILLSTTAIGFAEKAQHKASAKAKHPAEKPSRSSNTAASPSAAKR